MFTLSRKGKKSLNLRHFRIDFAKYSLLVQISEIGEFDGNINRIKNQARGFSFVGNKKY